MMSDLEDGWQSAGGYAPTINVTLQSNSGNGTETSVADKIGSAWTMNQGYGGGDPWGGGE